jgi:FK506-binding protein 1
MVCTRTSPAMRHAVRNSRVFARSQLTRRFTVFASQGECTKEIIKEGNGPTPKQGDTLTMHYTGTLLDGTKFDSSVDRGQPFVFQVGVQRVIRGWDEKCLQMKVGEKAKLVCPPEYAYGPRGIPGVIPENATLVFEIELLGIN